MNTDFTDLFHFDDTFDFGGADYTTLDVGADLLSEFEIESGCDDIAKSLTDTEDTTQDVTLSLYSTPPNKPCFPNRKRVLKC